MKLEYIPVGRIVNAHGTRGEVRLQPDGLSPDFLTRFETFVLLKLPGVDDMNTALSYKGKTLSIRRADAPLREGEYFDQDLLGLQVYDCETGELLGELQAVDPYPASKVYTVRGKKEYLIPAIPEVFIRSVDLDQNRMEVHILEGMATDEI